MRKGACGVSGRCRRRLLMVLLPRAAVVAGAPVSANVVGEAFEAVLAAIYLDSAGTELQTVRRWFNKRFPPDMLALLEGTQQQRQPDERRRE